MVNSIRLTLEPHLQDLGGFIARRSLPHEAQPMVGSFIFFDHLGPAVFPVGQGIDVRPHPHINLATVTYLFEGVMLHRDSLGSEQEIRPGAINWMTAGRGIVHSERSPASDRAIESTLHGIQTWVALPTEYEETEPSFVHYPSESLPTWEENGATVKLIAGAMNGHTSPVQTLSPILYLDVMLSSGAKFTLPDHYSERAIYSVTPGLAIDGIPLQPYRMAILTANCSIEISADTQAHCVVIGGEPVGQRYKWWNFVSSRPERIKQAKQDWKAGQFDPVPNEVEFIPLPE